MRRGGVGSLLFVALLAGTAAQAQSLGQASTAAGASFSSACAGLGFAGGGNAGDNVSRIAEGSNYNCVNQTSTVGGSVSTSASDSGTSDGVAFSNSASGSAGNLAIHIQATNTSESAAAFPAGETNAGFSDEITLTSPGMSGTGVWVVPIDIVGQMSAVGHGADGILMLAAFENHQMITQYDSATSLSAWNTFVALDSPLYKGSASGSSWDFENVQWRVADYGPGDPETLNTLSVNQTIFFAIPFTWGTPFDLGLYANVEAGELSSGALYATNTTTLDFHDTIGWGGPGYVLTNGGSGSSTTSFSITSLTGENYDEPHGVPEPAAWILALAGVGSVGMMLRHNRRRAVMS